MLQNYQLVYYVAKLSASVHIMLRKSELIIEILAYPKMRNSHFKEFTNTYIFFINTKSILDIINVIYIKYKKINAIDSYCTLQYNIDKNDLKSCYL